MLQFFLQACIRPFLVYKLKLIFPTSTAKGIPERHAYQDVLTQTACTLLLVNNNIHTTQASSDTIVFESDRDRTLAYLKLCKHAVVTPRYID